jgi:hypothetical protein
MEERNRAKSGHKSPATGQGWGLPRYECISVAMIRRGGYSVRLRVEIVDLGSKRMAIKNGASGSATLCKTNSLAYSRSARY